MKTIFALVDCNNFYVSCERVFNGSIGQAPVIVLSNNDSCVIARSNEAKALGIEMGVPVFRYQKLIAKHHIHVFSSNYALYADMSNRVMKILTQFAKQIEVYSIDEAFLDVSHIPTDLLSEFGQELCASVLKRTGIPVSVGIATTKTLSKVANMIVKKDPLHRGVLNISSATHDEIDNLLNDIPIGKVWGIGPRTAALFESNQIKTAKDLKESDSISIRKRSSVVFERIVFELRGISCNPLQSKTKQKKEIMKSSTFGRPIISLQELGEAVATYTAKAAEKLRAQNCVASSISIFIRTNPFDQKEPKYARSITKSLTIPTAYTPDLIQLALQMLKEIYKPGYRYKSAGILLSQFSDDSVIQMDLFNSIHDYAKKQRLMTTIDDLNRKWGNNVVYFGAQGIHRPWQMQQRWRSPRYTTHWDELLSLH